MLTSQFIAYLPPTFFNFQYSTNKRHAPLLIFPIFFLVPHHHTQIRGNILFKYHFNRAFFPSNGLVSPLEIKKCQEINFQNTANDILQTNLFRIANNQTEQFYKQYLKTINSGNYRNVTIFKHRILQQSLQYAKKNFLNNDKEVDKRLLLLAQIALTIQETQIKFQIFILNKTNPLYEELTIKYQYLSQTNRFTTKSDQADIPMTIKKKRLEKQELKKYCWDSYTGTAIKISFNPQVNSGVWIAEISFRKTLLFKSSLQFNKSIIFQKNRKMLSTSNNQFATLPNFFLSLTQPQFSYIQLQQSQPFFLNLQRENWPEKTLQTKDGKGKWTFDQQKQYLLFLCENKQEMRDKNSRKSKKVFLKMSQQVKTRSADQCRSHHQKVLKYHHSLQEIVRHYTQKVYTHELIFGGQGPNKSQDYAKTSIQLEPTSQPRLWVQGNRVRILIHTDLLNDY